MDAAQLPMIDIFVSSSSAPYTQSYKLSLAVLLSLPLWQKLNYSTMAYQAVQLALYLALLSTCAGVQSSPRMDFATIASTAHRTSANQDILNKLFGNHDRRSRRLESSSLELCEGDAPQVEEATVNSAFNCSCIPGHPTNSDATLSCISDCALCDPTEGFCGFTEYNVRIFDPLLPACTQRVFRISLRRSYLFLQICRKNTRMKERLELFHKAFNTQKVSKIICILRGTAAFWETILESTVMVVISILTERCAALVL